MAPVHELGVAELDAFKDGTSDARTAFWQETWGYPECHFHK